MLLAVTAVIGFILGCVVMYLIFHNAFKKKEKQLINNRKNLDMVNQWLILKHSGIELSKEIKKYGVKKIAVYGMGICGRHLVRELLNSDIEIAYALDSRKMSPYQKVEIRKLKDNMPEVDAVINTVVYDNEVINNALKSHFNCKIINLEDIIFESYAVDKGSR